MPSEVDSTPQEQQAPQQQQQQQEVSSKRPTCPSCGRPLRVCYCAALPQQPLVLGGHVLLLQHPQETKRTLATVPLLTRVLSPSSCTVLVGRRLVPHKWQQLDALMAAVQQQQVPLLVLFPGPGARSLLEVAQELQQRQQQHKQPGSQAAPLCDQQQQQMQQQQQPHQQGPQQEQQMQQQQQGTEQQTQPCSQPQPSPQQQQQQQQQQDQPPPAYVLVVVDSTWRQAREMFDALQPWLLGPGGMGGQQVQLPTQQQQQQQQTGQQQDGQQQQQQQQGVGVTGQPPSPTAAAEAAMDTLSLPASSSHAEGTAAPPPAAAATGFKDAETPVPSPAAGGVSPSSSAAVLLQRDSSCRLRTEPAEGTCTTLEAVAAAVAILEGDVGLFDCCMKPLRLLTQQQAAFDPAVAARVRPGGEWGRETQEQAGNEGQAARMLSSGGV